MMDLTSLWVSWQARQHWVGHAILGLLIFAAGWQLGRVMSPYYSSSPVVFETKGGEACPAAGGGIQELQALDAAGKVLAQGSPAVSPAVAGAMATAEPTTGPSPTVSPASTNHLFVASSRSTKYHHRECPSAGQIKPENQRWFATREEAEAAGYEPSQCTKQKLGL